MLWAPELRDDNRQHHARGKKFIKGSASLADYRPLGILIGWEVQGTFDVDLQIRNLSLMAIFA